MAQGALTMMPSLQKGMAASPAAESAAGELYQIQQCEKLVRFRDQVLAGNHPRIKPAHTASKPVANSSASQPSKRHLRPAPGKSHEAADDLRSFQANKRQSPVNMAATSAQLSSSRGFALAEASDGVGSGTAGAAASPSSPRLVAFSKTEINPVLLEKSEELIRAELTLQRQRLERSLKDQIDQRRAVRNALQDSEPLADFDLADVLTRALALVQSTAALTDGVAANASASSDSFDDKTFYSSEHETPEPPTKSPDAVENQDEEMRDSSPYEPELGALPDVPTSLPKVPNAGLQVQENISVQQKPLSAVENRQKQVARIPGLQSAHAAELFDSPDSGLAGRSKSSVNSASEHGDQRRVRDANQQSLEDTFPHQTSPIIRAHDLSPVAPQPAHVSPLAVARQPPLAQQAAGSSPATPPQVAALRKESYAKSSPENSSQGNMPPESKKAKKKKRKAERLAAESAANIPYIKPEPRSPSPLIAPAYGRPSKRQRANRSRPGSPSYGDSRVPRPIPLHDGYDEHYQPRIYQDERSHAPYERIMDPRLPQASRHEAVVGTSMGREHYLERRHPPIAQSLRPSSPGAYPLEYSPRDVRIVRSVSHAVFERPREDIQPAHYRDPREAQHPSVRPGVIRNRSRSPDMYERPASSMHPPPPPPRRIFVDEFGREYLEPPRPPTMTSTVVRQSVGPGPQPAKPEYIYERTISRRPEAFEENGLLVRRPSPSYVPQRLLVTQPELTAPEYRPRREREYSTRPLDEYAPTRPHLDSRSHPEQSHEYIARSASVRPAPEAIYRREVAYEGRDGGDTRLNHINDQPIEVPRYEVHPGYGRRVVDSRDLLPARASSVRPVTEPIRYAYPPRVGSVRPEQPAIREYATSIRPEQQNHREYIVQPPVEGRSYSVRPVEHQFVRQEYQLEPGAGYHELSAPRADQDAMYADPQAAGRSRYGYQQSYE